jgi:hypothetical protein
MILMLVIVFASPVLGIVRGVKNGSAANAVLSAFIPLYGLVYFFAAKR